jgi:7-cyano-7-deazaguanine synthase
MNDYYNGENRKAVVLLSGGIDSTTCLAIALSEKYSVFALSFYYHQRHLVEMNAAKRVAAHFGVENHLILELPLNRIGGSALTANIDVPKNRENLETSDEIPITYVPARNTIFLSFALGWAEVLSAANIFIGVNSLDYSGYPDCRPEYIQAFERMANLALKETVEHRLRMVVHTPLIHMTKAQIIKKGAELGIDYGLTHSCYDPWPNGKACGRCDSCILRRKGFLEAGVPDPTEYHD